MIHDLRADLDLALSNYQTLAKEAVDKESELRAKLERLTTDYKNIKETYRLEAQKVKRLRGLLQRVMDWCNTEDPQFEIEADVIKQALAETE